MATDFYSNQTGSTPHTAKNLGSGGVVRRLIKAIVTLDGTQVDEDDMFLDWLPAGTIIDPASSFVTTDGGIGATATINIGTPTSSSILGTAIDVATAGTFYFDGTVPYVLTVDEYVTADIEAIGTPGAGVLTFYIAIIEA